MQFLSNGAVAIADDGAAHGRIVMAATIGIEGVGIVGVGSDGILGNPDTFSPESNA